MATSASVHNRRMNKAAARAFREQRRMEREKRNAAWAVRMIRRCWIPPEETLPIHSDHRYWLARRAGWDVLSPKFAIGISGEPSIIPEMTAVWQWWIRLHWQQQVAMAKSASVRVGRAH